MAEIAEDIGPLGKDVTYRQTIMPDYLTGSFIANDTDDHIFKLGGQGKGRMTVCIDNLSNKTATITVYGSHSATADIGDSGVAELGGAGESGFTVLTTVCDYETYNDPFPYYIIRVTMSAVGDNKVVTLYVDFQGQ